ncbi:MAG TPA: mucoidy inhibitor MuiA family protein [Polyangia bacterium]|jgi:uncharacterized protein (TIGR02231 family)
MTVAREAASWIFIAGVTLVMGCGGPQLAAPPQHPATADVAGPVVAEVPEASDAQALESKVTRVTVYSDRARVTRQATVKVATEPTVFAFRKLPGWVDDGSVRVSVTEGRIIDVRVERNFLARATDRTYQRAKALDEALRSRLEALEDELQVLDAQKSQIEAIKAFSLEKINKEAVLGNIKVKSYAEVLEFISSSLRATAKARRAVLRQRDLITPEYQASRRTLAELDSLLKLEATTVLVTLQSSRATPSTVELTYMIPGATWEPMHDLRVSTADAKTAEVDSFAVVTQTSGEDWRDVELAFSTQSSTQSVRIPELEALTLGDTHTATRILTSQVSSFMRAQEAFQQQGQLWNKVHQRSSAEARASFDQAFKTRMEYLQVVQSKTVQIFESLQKRGTTAHFRANAAASVRGDGHPVRMRIGHSALQTDQKIVAAPEQSLNAARTLEMTNSSGQPLLPGKVALYQDGAFLGLTDIAFIAPGEPFSLFLSVADHLKLSRTLDRKHSSLVRKKRNKMQVAFIVTVENLSSQETAATLADRIPVSENKDIKIDNVKITDAVRPDSRGILHWALKLKPREKRLIRIAYEVEYPAELILETRRRHESAPAMKSPRYRGMSPSPAPAQPNDIGEQLRDLEAFF